MWLFGGLREAVSPTGEVPGALEPCEPGLQKLELDGPVAPGLVSPNMPQTCFDP